MNRVALVVAGPYPHPRGSQMLLRQMENGLRRRGHAVCVLSHGRTAPAAPSVGPARLWRGLRLVRSLWRVARDHGLDVIHAHNYEATLLALPVARATRTPLVFHGHAAFADELPHYVSAAWRRPAAWVGAWLDGRVPRWADAVVTVTPSLAERLVAGGVLRERVTHVRPALPSHECATTASPAEVAQRVCYAGNLDGYQNLAFLRAAFARVRTQLPAAALVVVTDEVPSARQDWSNLPGVTVHWHADLATVRSVVASAAVAVVPRTDPTGFPMKLLNYLAAGKAIVVCQGAAQDLQPDIEALVVSDGDVVSFADAIVRLLRDAPLRQRLGAAARRRIDPAAADESLEQIEAVYRRVVRPRAHPLHPITQAE